METKDILLELRQKNRLSQEELAEKVFVTRQAVSRWETGTNMPVISLLVVLADFYGISIPELLDGERKSEKMNNEVRETALKLSGYAEMINEKLRQRLFWLTVLALAGMTAFAVIEFTGMDTPGSLYERIASAGLGLGFGMLVALAMYLSGLLGKIKAKKLMHRNTRRASR